MSSQPILRRSMAELDAWLASVPPEEVIDPAQAIVDAHHHMWWRPPEAYQFPEILADVQSGHDVRATVFMQCTAMYRADGPEAFRPVGETEYVNGVAAISASGMFGASRICAGIVSYADLRLGDAVAPVLEAHVAAGGGRFRGVRQQAQQDPHVGPLAKAPPPKDLLANPAFRTGFARIAPLGLRFDAWVYFTQLGDLAALADAFPETPIILNHIGAPLGVGYYADRRNEVFAAWSKGIAELARRPNVTVKLGGLGMAAYGFGFENRERPAASEDLAAAWRPYIEHCILAFGASRCMFESNFPLDKQAFSYRTMWNAFKRIVSGASENEKNALFFGTAVREYALDLPVAAADRPR